jgi:hypothetical protein
MKNKKIEFVNVLGVNDIYSPSPSSQEIPEWYRQTPSYKNDKKVPAGEQDFSTTVKKCIPVFDAITSGYIIKSYTDIYISQKYGYPFFEWPSLSPMQFHPLEQAELHPKQNGISYPKWVNAWGVKTPLGYSSLFIQPMHRESVFEILPGVVDTDTCFAPVNFPFVLKDNSFEGLIPAGTPIAQVVPFKRDSWKMEKSDSLKESADGITKLLRSRFFDSYKNLFWERKNFK